MNKESKENREQREKNFSRKLVIIVLLVGFLLCPLFASEEEEKIDTAIRNVAYSLVWNWGNIVDNRGEIIGVRYKFYPSDTLSTDALGWTYVDTLSLTDLEVKTPVYDAGVDSYTFEIQYTNDGFLFSESNYVIWQDNAERSRFSLGGYLSMAWNLKYFPNAKKKGVERVTFSTLPFGAWTAGLDLSYNLFDSFSIGLDTSFSFYNYRKDLKDHFIQLSTEVLGELKFSLGGDIRKSQRRNIWRFALSLLGGGALYTNFSIRNLVPGGGVKLAVEVYNSTSWGWRLVLRTTAYYMQQVDSRYNSLDMSVSCGLGVSWNNVLN